MRLFTVSLRKSIIRSRLQHTRIKVFQSEDKTLEYLYIKSKTPESYFSLPASQIES